MRFNTQLAAALSYAITLRRHVAYYPIRVALVRHLKRPVTVQLQRALRLEQPSARTHKQRLNLTQAWWTASVPDQPALYSTRAYVMGFDFRIRSTRRLRVMQWRGRVLWGPPLRLGRSSAVSAVVGRSAYGAHTAHFGEFWFAPLMLSTELNSRVLRAVACTSTLRAHG